jgi:hypothetical protein
VPQAPSSFNVDLIRASIGPELAAPYEQVFGAVPWLTAGTLAWPAGEADRVLGTWLRWTRRMPGRTLSAIRLGACDVAIDVAVVGDPWGAPGSLSALRDLAPALDTVALVGPRKMRSPASVAAAALTLPAVPAPGPLLDAAAATPDGVCLGLRHGVPPRVELIGVAAVDELPRALAAVDQAARGFGGQQPSSGVVSSLQ